MPTRTALKMKRLIKSKFNLEVDPYILRSRAGKHQRNSGDNYMSWTMPIIESNKHNWCYVGSIQPCYYLLKYKEWILVDNPTKLNGYIPSGSLFEIIVNFK